MGTFAGWFVDSADFLALGCFGPWGLLVAAYSPFSPSTSQYSESSSKQYPALSSPPWLPTNGKKAQPHPFLPFPEQIALGVSPFLLPNPLQIFSKALPPILRATVLVVAGPNNLGNRRILSRCFGSSFLESASCSFWTKWPGPVFRGQYFC